MMKSAVRMAVAVALVFMLAVAAFADITGDIQGTVIDPAGAMIAAAKVTIKNLSTGATRTVVANEAGEFSSPQMDIGNYQVTVEKDGFKAFSQTVVVRSGERTRIEAKLEVGNVTESVQVESSALPTLDVASAQVSESLNSQEVLSLPNLARDPVAFATLGPGTVPVSVNNPFLGAGSFNSNGSRGRANNISLDGVTAADISTTGESGAAFVQDSIAEVKVITNNFDAEFGRNSGSQVQLITKSGTNQYHGSAYEYFQNTGLGDARGYFQPANTPIPRFVQNQGGVTFGGPILKDRTFFYGTWEVERTAGGSQPVVANVLTPAQAAGITDPTSLALFNQYGAPVSPAGTPGSLTQISPNTTHGDTWTVRVDQVLRGGKDTLFVKYGQAPATTVNPGLTFIFSNLNGFGASVTAEPRDLTIGYTSAFNSNLVNSFHFGFGRVNPDFPINSPFKPGPQIFFLDGTSALGPTEILPQGRVQNTFQYLDVVTWTKGRHTLRFGPEFDRYQAPSTFQNEALGQLVYANIAAFQAGQPLQWQQILGPTDRHNFAFDAFGFIQDDFRVTRTLTVNLGFRLESSGGVSEGANLLSNLNPLNHTPIGALGVGPLGGVDLGGTAFHRNYNSAPRLGFAWNPWSGKLVFRGGYGIAYDFIYQNPITNLRFAPPFTSTITIGNFTGGNTLANLIAGTAPAQTAALAGLGTFSPGVIDFGNFAPVSQNLQNPRNQQWDFGVEYQAPFNTVLKATYVGARSDRLQVSMPINLVNPANIPAAPTSLADQQARAAEFVDAFNNEIGSNTASGLNNLIDQRFDNVTQVQSTGTSLYNSLQLEAIRRFRNGLTFDANYTWAHSIDDVSDALGVLINDSPVPLDASKPISFQRANSEFDIRNRFVVSYVYEIPFAKGMHGWKRYVLDGWSQSGIFSTQTGLPTTIFAAPISLNGVAITDLLLNGTNNGGRATNTAVNGNANMLQPVPFFNGYAVPTTLPVSEPLLEQNGTSGRNQLRLAGQTDYDAAFSKSFKFTESKYLQLRWEAFNVFNHPNFAGYINNLGSNQFNTYTSTATNARTFQLSGRFIF